MKLAINGHSFEFLGAQPYTRLDGSSTFLNVWRTRCAHDGCSAQWEFKTPASDDPSRYPPGGSTHKGYGFTQRHCQAHRPKRVAKPTTYASRQRVTAEDVQVMHQFASTFSGTRNALYQALAITFGLSPGTTREILAGRRRQRTADAPHGVQRDRGVIG
jgi:hypothetical protein